MSGKFFKDKFQWYTELPPDAIAVYCDDDIIIHYHEATRGIYVDDAPSDPVTEEEFIAEFDARMLRDAYRNGCDLTWEEMRIAYPDDYYKMETSPDKPEEPVDITDATKALDTLQRYLGVSYNARSKT